MSTLKTTLAKHKGMLLLAATAVAAAAVALAQLPPDPTRTGTVQRPQAQKEETNLKTVEGEVQTSANAPVNGAIVQLKDTQTLQIRSFRTQADGKFRFAGLRTDADYELRATQGESASDTKRLSSFDSRKTITVVLNLTQKK